MKTIGTFCFLFIGTVSITFGQYNSCSGKSTVTETVTRETKDEYTGEITTVKYEAPVQQKDNYGNADGTQYDLAVDGAFTGQTIVVLQLYSFDFSMTEAALLEKGFGVKRFTAAPNPEDLKKALKDACQVWVISNITPTLTLEHAEIIKQFYESGRGVYLWADNDPGIPDANLVAKHILGVTMEGDYYGDHVVTLKTDSLNAGMRKDHLITTGLEHLYEGITISHLVDPENKLTPLTWSSDGNVVTAIIDDQQHRLIIDGGFTRLYCKWDSAGTGRYVKNAAAWLANFERFGDEILSEDYKKEREKMKAEQQ